MRRAIIGNIVLLAWTMAVPRGRLFMVAAVVVVVGGRFRKVVSFELLFVVAFWAFRDLLFRRRISSMTNLLLSMSLAIVVFFQCFSMVLCCHD